MDMAYVAVSKGDAYTLGIAKRGERGYHPTDYPTVPTYEEAAEWARSCNSGMMSDDEANAIVLSTF